MYIQIGGDMAVRRHTIIGIFDLDNASYSKHTRKFLQDAEENGRRIAEGIYFDAGVRHRSRIPDTIQRSDAGKTVFQ